MKRLSMLSFLAGLSACSCGPQGNGLAVTLETAAERAETCFAVEVLDRSGTRLAESRFPRDEARTTYRVGVFRGELPADVTLRARALIGTDCATATKENGVSPAVDATFDPKRLVNVTLSLTAGDADGDGFVSRASGGGDCDDTTITISPGEQETCFGDVDHDCNGLAGCADPACAATMCGGVAEKLKVRGVPSALRTGACSGAVFVDVQDALGRVTLPPAQARVTMGGPFLFFSDPACTTPASDVPLTVGASFAFVGPQLGVGTLTVSSAPLTSDARDVTIEPSVPEQVRFTTPPVMVAAGACSPELVLELFDDAGLPTLATSLVSLALSSDAGGPFGLYDDGACTVPVSALSLDAGTGRGVFHFSGQRAGAFTVRADSTTVGSAQQGAAITPGPIAAVQVSIANPVLTAFTCSEAFVVQAFDAFGNAVTLQQLTVSVPDAGATVFTGTTCATPGTSDRFALVATEEGTFPVTVTAGGVSASQNVLVRRPGPAGSTWRWPLTVTTGNRDPAGGYQGYTLQATFDSRAAVDAGQLAANASDLRVHFWFDAGWQELDRLVENPNSANTVVRFASQTGLPTSATDLRYSFFSGAFDGGSAPSNPNAVYLFTDDFEGANLSKWTIRSGGWSRATDRAHGGSGALKFGTENNANHYIEANPALNEADVMFEAWWNTSNTGDTDFSQVLRLQPGASTNYETNLQDTGGWSLAWQNAGTWASLVNARVAPTQNAWMLIGLSMSGSELRVWKERVQINPMSGAHTVAEPPLPSGNVGFRKWDLGGAIWIDDVTVRRYTEPEPGVVVGAPYRVP